MTEREIPDASGFLFGGMTDDSNTVSAPPTIREPENPAVVTSAPVFLSRRELRAAGGYEADAAALASSVAPTSAPAGTPALAAPAEQYDGVASLFPLLGEAPVAPLDAPLAPPSPFDAVLAPAPTGAATSAPAPAGITAAFPAPTAAEPTAHRAPSRSRSSGIRPSGIRTKRSATRPSSKRPASGRTNARDDAGKSLGQRLFGVGVMVIVGGLFAVLAIPAYADNDATALTAAAAVHTQKVAVAGAAASTITTAARDSYTATSAADLKALYANALRQQAIEAYLLSGAKAKGDDYPWFANPTRAEGGGLSPLGYYYRECVDFVAWRLNRDAGAGPNGPFPFTWSYLTPNGGDGHDWKPAWVAHGWATGTTPKPGAVAWFFDNHVGYVNGVLDDGQVLIEEYNYTPHAYSQRVIDPSQAYYLYAPPLP